MPTTRNIKENFKSLKKHKRKTNEIHGSVLQGRIYIFTYIFKHSRTEP